MIVFREKVLKLIGISKLSKATGYGPQIFYAVAKRTKRCSSELIEAVLRVTGMRFEDIFEIIDDPGPYAGHYMRKKRVREAAEKWRG